MSRPDYGPTTVAYGGPLSTYMDGSLATHRRLTAVSRPRPAVEPMSRPDYGPTAVAYVGPLSTYMDGSSAAHRRLTAVGRPRPAVEPMSRPDYGSKTVAYDGPTAVAYGGPLSTYTHGSSAAHRRLTSVSRPRPAVEPMSRPDYGPTAVAINGPLMRVTMGRWWAAVVVLSGIVSLFLMYSERWTYNVTGGLCDSDQIWSLQRYPGSVIRPNKTILILIDRVENGKSSTYGSARRRFHRSRRIEWT